MPVPVPVRATMEHTFLGPLRAHIGWYDYDPSEKCEDIVGELRLASQAQAMMSAEEDGNMEAEDMMSTMMGGSGLPQKKREMTVRVNPWYSHAWRVSPVPYVHHRPLWLIFGARCR